MKKNNEWKLESMDVFPSEEVETDDNDECNSIKKEIQHKTNVT